MNEHAVCVLLEIFYRKHQMHSTHTRRLKSKTTAAHNAKTKETFNFPKKKSCDAHTLFAQMRFWCRPYGIVDFTIKFKKRFATIGLHQAIERQHNTQHTISVHERSRRNEPTNNKDSESIYPHDIHI